MPQVKFERIVSCSSEDPAHPATNLLLSKEVNRKWKCKAAGEESASVIIQLKEPYAISGIDVGNESSSFVEVLVSRTSTPDDFKVLLPKSSLMTPMDARAETNRNRVRMFSQSDLPEPVQKEKWDRIKVICTQQFSKRLQYGLSFLVLHTKDIRNEETQATQSSSRQQLGRFALKDEDQSDIQVGSFFSRRKDFMESSSPAPSKLTGAAAVRDASTAAYLANDKGHGKRKNSETASRHTKKETKKNSEDTAQISPQGQSKKKKETPENTPSVKYKRDKRNTDGQNSGIPSTSQSSIAKDTKQSQEKLVNNVPNISYKPFNKLLEGVEIVISGYVNPGRSEIRDKALQMGAKYKPDWCNSSTHLICAFANTPKFQQVKGKGIIVFRDWIDECFKQRKKLFWKKFAVDNVDKKAKDDGTDSEIWELIPSREENNEPVSALRSNRNSLAMKDTRLRSDSSSDSEDEIERIRAKQALKISSDASGAVNSRHHNEVREDKNQDMGKKDDVYEASTDIDSEEESRKHEMLWTEQKKKENSSHELPYLPDFFQHKTFYLSSDLSENEKQSLSRYIIAFGGQVLQSIKRPPHFVLAWNKSVIEKAPANSVFVSPNWIWECNDRRKLVPPNNYELH